ncbi:MAG: chemotaxis protein CheX [Verrucomicrobiota bacterium]
MSTHEDIAKNFGLDSVPESVKRLTQMISGRGATIEEFGKFVSQDPELTKRLLKFANPRAVDEFDYNITTVDGALQRTGMSVALVLAMGDPLVRAVVKTFDTMLGIQLELLPVSAPFQEAHIMGEVGFTGKATGKVQIRLTKSSVPLIGERLLGLDPSDLADPAMAADVIGELCNMVAGNFKSNLCDAGLTCTLMPPKITITDNFSLEKVDGGTSERHPFRSPELPLFVDLGVNPWAGD